jgi:hypothetical protein
VCQIWSVEKKKQENIVPLEKLERQKKAEKDCAGIFSC